MWNLLFKEITYNYLPDIMWPPENSAYFPEIKHMYVIPSVEIGVQPKCHGELSTFNSPQEESDFWYSGNCATKTDGETGSVWFSSIWFWFQIENRKSKIHNRDFQCLIPQELKITNLQSQLSIFVSKKHKIEKLLSMFWKSKIENWKWSVGGF